ncbi:MAG: signal protein [Burkholderiales bacterium RIFCSPHIGHO2_12_FULL_69_20]|nr:MAG: signal protein [Burkholderiales bacterium RIFCSPHIGHO2_12_FULL_69_20]
MKLLVKFNLIFVSVVAVGIAVSGWITRDLLQGNAREEVRNNARLLMESATAVRGYTAGQITGLLEAQMKVEFLPQAVPSYSATEVQNALHAKYPAYAYKEATLNPTNPRDRAVGWEVDIVGHFRSDAELKEFVGQRDTPTGPSLYVARPLRITNPACLQCHSSLEAAPKTMIARYGPANGFGWTLNEVIGAQIVSVPMAVPLARAAQSFNVFIGSLLAVFLVVGVVLNLMIWWVVVRPVTRLSLLADRVSQGDLSAPEFAAGSRDEIGVLAVSFARMRASVVQAMKMLEG